MKFQANGEIAIYVQDLGRARHFYGEIMSFPLVGEEDGMVAFDAGQFRLYVLEGPGTMTYIPSFDSDATVQETRDHLVRSGCTQNEPTADGTVYFTDPFGFIFDVVPANPEDKSALS